MMLHAVRNATRAASVARAVRVSSLLLPLVIGSEGQRVRMLPGVDEVLHTWKVELPATKGSVCM